MGTHNVPSSTIAVLGTGPAGLCAAHACALAGYPVALFSATDEPSTIGGAQFLHQPIPMYSDKERPDFHITYMLQGSPDNYMRKVYGPDPIGWPQFVSMANVADGQVDPAWDLRSVYERMHSEHAMRGAINVVRVDATWLADNLDDFAAVVSTVPAPALCTRPQEHHFGATTVYVNKDDEHWQNAVRTENTIIYNGQPSPSWYRASRIRGVVSIEWGNLPPALPLDDVRVITKPTHTNCNCWEGKVIRVGRYGRWEKEGLVHHAFYDTYEMVQGGFDAVQ